MAAVAAVATTRGFSLHRLGDDGLEEDPVITVAERSAAVGEKLRRAQRLMDDTRDLAQDNLSHALTVAAQVGLLLSCVVCDHSDLSSLSSSDDRSI